MVMTAAAQNILGDLFASLSIVLDKPFVLGDFLAVGDFLGSVEQIGLKTTRVRSLSGEQLVFSNADLLSSRIRNFGRMYERRVPSRIGVTYQTPRDKLERIPEIIRQAVEERGDQVRFDRSHLAAWGDFAIIFETVYFVLSPDYRVHMDIQQAIALRVHERFEAEAIEFAYPTQTIFLAQAG
jgi:small-conductance mechanosensitive channel